MYLYALYTHIPHGRKENLGIFSGMEIKEIAGRLAGTATEGSVSPCACCQRKLSLDRSGVGAILTTLGVALPANAKPEVRLHGPLALNGALKAHQEAIWGQVFPLGRAPRSLVQGRGSAQTQA